ncbi:hypothetical protein GTV15_13435, partial [Streptomyces sp. SID7803]|nr:hypothetical protein [Streptomyces sp. SID7803]
MTRSPQVLDGFWTTLLATVFGTLVAAVLGLAIAVAGRAPVPAGDRAGE